MPCENDFPQIHYLKEIFLLRSFFLNNGLYSPSLLSCTGCNICLCHPLISLTACLCLFVWQVFPIMYNLMFATEGELQSHRSVPEPLQSPHTHTHTHLFTPSICLSNFPFLGKSRWRHTVEEKHVAGISAGTAAKIKWAQHVMLEIHLVRGLVV